MGSLRKYSSEKPQDLFSNPFLKFQEEVNHVMSDFYHMFEPDSTSFSDLDKLCITPALDLVEDKECFKLEVEMPGMGEEDIRVSFDGNKVTIEGEKCASRKDDKKSFISREICYGHYERSFTLPLSADVDHAKASFKKGMLWITIPKKKATKNTCKNIKIEKAK